MGLTMLLSMGMPAGRPEAAPAAVGSVGKVTAGAAGSVMTAGSAPDKLVGAATVGAVTVGETADGSTAGVGVGVAEVTEGVMEGTTEGIAEGITEGVAVGAD